MKIIKLHVENFGTLSNFDMDFEEGINTVLQENGWGKSTLAAFLRAMFYGLEGERKRGYAENERTRYIPWNKRPFGGSLEFETGGKRYLVTRNFGQKEKDSSFRLQDAVTLLDSKDYSEHLGEEVFGIDKESFGKTSFIDHDSIHYAGINSVIGARVGSVDKKDDLKNYDGAMNDVKNYLSAHSPKSKKGRLYQLNDEIKGLERAVEKQKTLDEKAEGLRKLREREKERLEELKKEQGELQKERVKLSENQTKAINLKRLREYENEACIRQKAVKEREEGFHGRIPAWEELEHLEEEIQACERQSVRADSVAEAGSSERLRRLSAYFRKGVPTQSRITEQIKQCNELQGLLHERENLEGQEVLERRNQDDLDLARKRLEASIALASARNKEKARKGILLACAFFIPAILLGAMCALLHWNTLVWIPVVVLLIAGILSLLSCGRNDGKADEDLAAEEKRLSEDERSCGERLDHVKKALRELDGKIASHEDSIREFLDGMEISYSRVDAESILYEMKNRVVEYTELLRENDEAKAYHEKVSKEAEALRQQLEKSLAKLEAPSGATDYAGIRKWISDTGHGLAAYEAEKLEEEKAVKMLEKFRSAHDDLADWTDMRSEEEIQALLEKANARESEIQDEGTRIHENVSNYNRELEDILDKLEEIAQLKEKRDGLREEQEREETRYHLVQKTQEYLQGAKEQFIARFINPVKNAFDVYYGIMTNGREDGSDFQIDANLNLYRREEGEFRDIQAQSAGYADMIGLCIRMALLDVMYKDEKPMIIMDDPFTDLDQNNLEGAKRFLEKISGNYQILYFTCHQSRMTEKG